MPAKQQQGKLVTDSRFAAVHHDPRFQRFPKAKAKVEIDERFSGAYQTCCSALGTDKLSLGLALIGLALKAARSNWSCVLVQQC